MLQFIFTTVSVEHPSVAQKRSRRHRERNLPKEVVRPGFELFTDSRAGTLPTLLLYCLLRLPMSHYKIPVARHCWLRSHGAVKAIYSLGLR